MLNGGGDDMLTPLAEALDGAMDGPVVGLGAAGGKEYPVGSAPNAAATLCRASRIMWAVSMPKLYRALGLPQFSVIARVMASTASGQGLVVAELSK